MTISVRELLFLKNKYPFNFCFATKHLGNVQKYIQIDYEIPIFRHFCENVAVINTWFDRNC